MKKITKKSMSVFIGIGCLIGIMSQPTHSVYAATFGGGDGSLGNPYLISTPEHLNQIRESVNSGESYYGVYFKQTAPIDFKYFDNDDDLSNGNFAPIGDEINTFNGNYDGDYYTITNVKIVSDQTCVGFFGKTGKNVSIKNIAFENLTIQSSGQYTGGVIGYADATELDQISVTGTVNSSYTTSTGRVGGIVGYLYSSLNELNSIRFSGDIHASGGYTGGIVGSTKSSSKLKNLLVSGNIKSTGSYIGGILGYAETSLTLQNVLVLSKLTGGDKGGIVGSTRSVSGFKNLYWDKTVSGTSYGNRYNTGGIYQEGMIGLTTDQLQGEAAKTNLVGFDFDNVWETTDGLPRLKWLNKLKSPLTPGTHEVLLAGKVEPTLLSLTVPADPINFVINPNLPDEEMFVAPQFQITNATRMPVSLSLHEFEKVTGPFNDVLPTEHDDWFNLETSELFDFALGIQPVSGQGWRSLTEGVRYVADKSNYDLGVLEPKGTVSFKLVAHHGTLFNTSFETTYRLTFIVGV